ncbi:hypothetical protein KM043_013713 [Ampulex compressa]|nr:hypothetical protein KM043_013713 [Ampulex compressa]
MTRNALPLARLSLCLLLIVACASIVKSSSARRERRHVGVEESSHRPDRIQTTGNRSFKPSTGKQNEITAEPGRKVSHRLIGGHLRVHAKPEPDEAFWDDGILVSSAGNGKESRNGARAEDDDERKTLSQQVKEGKYGLIQNEIYGEQPKRPGIISYLGNPEVPKDTIDNLGGLDEEEIWLAENHMLVLKGGRFPGHEGAQGSGDDGGQRWPPIDDYKAPRRQVKIPPRPKVPPPFPVQLTEGGPVQIIGSNGTKEDANGTLDYRTDSLFSKGLLPGEEPFFAITANGTILVPDLEDSRNLTTTAEKSSSLTDAPKRTKAEQEPASGPPFYHAIPPGAVFVAPPSNQSDYEDDDQSIYYPPPYSFFYQQDNTTAVPPGPLVPGIILPPPPDFFSILDEKKTTTKKQTKRPGTSPVPRIRPTYLPPRKLTTKAATKQQISTTVPTATARASALGSSVTKILGRTSQRNATGAPTSQSRQRTTPRVETTTPTPEKPTTIENTEYYSIGPIIGNQVSETSTEGKSRAWPSLVTGKAIPVLTYYATTTQSSLEKPVEVTPASIKNIVTTGNPGRGPNQASYYFYEESSNENTRTTTDPSTIYYRTTTESPYFELQTEPRQKEQKKQYYTIEAIPSEQTSKEYSAKLIDSIVKNSRILGYTDSSSATRTSPKYGAGLGRSQSPRTLTDHAPLYYQTISTGPALSVQSYYTSPKPQTYYREEAKPKPIYQYSFQATDYTKRAGDQRQYYKQRQQDVYNKYQDAKSSRPQYDYESKDSVPEQQLRPQTLPYDGQQRGYTSSTAYPTINTTPNPQHAYYTQQDEKLLDDVTKEYFTIFGKKISGKTLPSTTPLYGKSSSITERPDYDVIAYVQNGYNDGRSTYKAPKVKVHYGDQPQPPYSLKDDTLVNYRKPLPPINPDSEFITVVNHKQQSSPLPAYRVHTEGYRLENRVNPEVTPVRGYTGQQVIRHESGAPSNFAPAIETSVESLESSVESLEAYPQRPLSLEGDIEVNYRDPRPTLNPDAEFIDPVSVQDDHPGKPNAYFAYSLPGDGGHFYFLTPQAITQRQEEHDGYLYSKPRGERLLRRRRGPAAV